MSPYWDLQKTIFILKYTYFITIFEVFNHRFMDFIILLKYVLINHHSLGFGGSTFLLYFLTRYHSWVPTDYVKTATKGWTLLNISTMIWYYSLWTNILTVSFWYHYKWSHTNEDNWSYLHTHDHPLIWLMWDFGLIPNNSLLEQCTIKPPSNSHLPS